MTSFPYFTIAREHRQPYGLVLAYAGMREHLLTLPLPSPKQFSLADTEWLTDQMIEAANELPDNVRSAIKAAVYHEHQRRGKEKFK